VRSGQNTCRHRFLSLPSRPRPLIILLKPFGDDRVRKALARARTFLDGAEHRAFQGRLTGLLATAADDPRRCILVKVGDRVVILRPSEIDWVEAEGDYVRLHVGQDSHFVRSTLAHIEEKLAPEGFVRIHRSRLVNFQRVKELRPVFSRRIGRRPQNRRASSRQPKLLEKLAGSLWFAALISHIRRDRTILRRNQTAVGRKSVPGLDIRG